MGLDYYSVLGLTRSATREQVQQGFRSLALKYHPSRDGSPEAALDYVRVCEAYDVLSDPKTKAFYDLHGEGLLKTGRPDGKGGTQGGVYSFSPAKCDAIFAAFFGTENPFEALEDISATFEALAATADPQAGRKLVHTVHLTLEEVHHGCIKTVRFQPRRMAAGGEATLEERELTIDVKPGLPDGTRFVFEGEGNVVPGKTPGAVVFLLATLPHAAFERRGADLVHRPRVPLVHALAAKPLVVTLLDGSSVTVPVDDILTPGCELTVPGKGLPNPAAGPGARGALTLVIDVLFPKKLSEAQKMLIAAATFLPEDKAQSDAVKTFQRAFQDPLTGWQTGVF